MMLIGSRRFSAFLDTGAEISIINCRVAEHTKTMQIRPKVQKKTIHLVDGTTPTMPRRVRLPLHIVRQRLEHTFQRLPSLE